jgi:hypothetical protein
MKNLILNFGVLAALCFVFALSSCKKIDPVKKDPKGNHCNEPCKNAELVISLEAEHYSQCHFQVKDFQGATIFLYASNYNTYKDKIRSGLDYNLAYTEVDCKDCDAPKGFAEGGCFVITKCVKITCLEDAGSTCNPTIINPKDYADRLASASQGAYIEGNALKGLVWFTGCSATDQKDFKLLASPRVARCPGGSPVFIAKIVNDFQGFTCQAIFNIEQCFDLSPIRQYYETMNREMPNEIIIQLENGQSSEDLMYYP